MELYIKEQPEFIEIYSCAEKSCIGYTRFDSNQTLGNIYIGKVESVVKALNAAFVILEGEVKAYLPVTECKDFLQLTKDKREFASISSFVHVGEWVLVQIIKDATGEKLPKVTQNIEWKSKNLLYKPYEFMCAVSKKLSLLKKREIIESFTNEGLHHDGVLFRSSSEHIPVEDLKQEFYDARDEVQQFIKRLDFAKKTELIYKELDLSVFIWQQFSNQLVEKIHIQSGEAYRKLKGLYGEEKVPFQLDKVEIPETIVNQVKQALQKEIFLPNGGSIVIEETESFTVIDVNSKKSTHKRQYEATVRETNKMAAKEIAHQIMLRNIGGSILIDFISMKNKQHQKEVREALIDSMRIDKIPHRILSFTELGILEMTRQRKTTSLREQLTKPCEACKGQGFIE